MALFINYHDGKMDCLNVGESLCINQLDLLGGKLDSVVYIQADGHELEYIHSMNYHNTGKRVQIYYGEVAKDILANW